MLRRYTKKGLERRKSNREGFKEFFEKHVSFIKNNKIHCAECGERLKGDVSEVAHILNKDFFKSLALLDENVVYLCGWKSNNNCHSILDSSIDNFVKMKIHDEIIEKIKILIPISKEKINYKTIEKYKLWDNL